MHVFDGPSLWPPQWEQIFNFICGLEFIDDESRNSGSDFGSINGSSFGIGSSTDSGIDSFRFRIEEFFFRRSDNVPLSAVLDLGVFSSISIADEDEKNSVLFWENILF